MAFMEYNVKIHLEKDICFKNGTCGLINHLNFCHSELYAQLTQKKVGMNTMEKLNSTTATGQEVRDWSEGGSTVFMLGLSYVK